MNTFATKDHPIRCSYLRWISCCTMRAALDFIVETSEEVGAAAANGTCVHAGVAAFHTTRGPHAERVAAAIAAMQVSLQENASAEPDECRLFLTPYLADPRNQSAEIARIPTSYPYAGQIDPTDPRKMCPNVGDLALEVYVRIVLPPHPIDSTRESIHITGHLDQIRIEQGRQLLCDLKTGQPSGLQLVHDYSYQLAGYTLGGRQNGWTNLEPGYIIRARRYRERNAGLPSPSGVYWNLPFGAADCESLLDQVRLNIALIRMGLVNFGTGPHCCYCHHRGLDGCIPRAKEKLGISLA